MSLLNSLLKNIIVFIVEKRGRNLHKKEKIILLVFGILIFIGTFFDYQITEMLDGHLTIIASFTEIFGELPFVLSLVIPFVIYFNYRDKENLVKSNTLGFLYSLLGSFFSFMVFNTIFRYTASSSGGDSHGEVTRTMNILSIVLGVLLYVFLVFYIKKREIKDIKKLKSAANKMLLLSLSTVLLTNLIKVIFARPRYWTITAGLHEFNPWYQINGPQLSNATMSFVSGHTANAFVLLAFAYFFNKGSKQHKNILISAMIWGTLVGIGRLFSGQHFLTDVAFAGLLVIGLYLLIDKKFKSNNKEIEKIN